MVYVDLNLIPSEESLLGVVHLLQLYASNKAGMPYSCNRLNFGTVRDSWRVSALGHSHKS